MDLKELGKIPLETLHDRPPVEVSVSDALVDVVNLMVEHSCGAVLVKDGGELVGIFTERDLMFKIDHSSDAWKSAQVREHMTAEPVCVSKMDSIASALNLMIDGAFRHLPVVDDSDRVVCVVSIRDVLAYIAENFPKQFLNLPPEPSREATERYGG